MRVPDDEFIAAWNAATSLGEVAAWVRDRAGPVPRWAVVARAVACRAAGAGLKAFADEAPPRREPEAIAAARAAAARLMAEFGLGGWQFGFNSNVRRAGVCRYPTPTRPGRIELSRHFVARNAPAEVLDTILHELAHALVGPRHGHDAVWKAKCVEIGAKPERCYGEQVEMPKGRWRAVCPGCQKAFDRHRRPPRATGWYCKPCGKDRGPLTWAEAV